MNKTTISFNASSDVKNRLQKMAAQYGITISDLMRMSALKVVDEGLVIEPGLKPTPYLETVMREADDDIKHGRTYGPFSTVNEMFGALDKADDDEA